MNAFLVCAALTAAAEPAPSFDVRTAGDADRRGTIRSLDAAGALTLGDGETVAPGRLVSLRRLDRPLPPWPDGPQLRLHNGDRLAGTAAAIDGAALIFRAASADPADKGAGLRFPLTAVGYLWVRPPAALDGERFPEVFAAERPADRVVLRNGDAVVGTVTGLDAAKKELRIEAGGTTRGLALDKVVVVAFSTRLARARKPAGPYGHLVLTNGTRLTVVAPTIANGVVSAQTIYREALAVPLEDAAALDIYRGKAVYLSDLKPTACEYRSYQGEEFTWAADRNLAGGELQLRAGDRVSTYDKGIAMHAESRLRFALDGKYSRFESAAGLDARLGRRGSVRVRALMDGKEFAVNDGKALTAASAPAAVRLDVTGVRELTLVVLWGDGGHVGDHVNWCDARLLP